MPVGGGPGSLGLMSSAVVVIGVADCLGGCVLGVHAANNNAAAKQIAAMTNGE